MSTLKGSNIAGSTPTRGRVEHDYYATPEETTMSILNEVRLDGSILEPACGEGHISEVLKKQYPSQEVVSTDLIDRGYGEGSFDFLENDYERTFNNVITNPPFKYMLEFTEKALEIAEEKVLMLGKIQFLESAKRKPFFKKNPPKYVYVFSNRQHLMRNGSAYDDNGKFLSTVMCFAWFYWEKGYEGETVLKWI